MKRIVERRYLLSVLKNHEILSTLMEGQLIADIKTKELKQLGFDFHARTHTVRLGGINMGCVREYAIIEKPFSFGRKYRIYDTGWIKDIHGGFKSVLELTQNLKSIIER